MTNPRVIKTFSEFSLLESLHEDTRDTTLGPSKVEKYRSIAYKLSEIFGLYGFFLGLKPGFFDEKNWPNLMNEIIVIKDPKLRWDKITRLSKFLQTKVASPEMIPNRKGDFGFAGEYDYDRETKELPNATQYLRNASDALFQTYTPEEKTKALSIMDEVLKKMKPITFSSSGSIAESENFSPSDQDLLLFADTIGTRLLNMLTSLDSIKRSFPESAQQIDSFVQTSIEPNLDKIRIAIDEDIPKLGPKARGGYYKRLEAINKNIDSLQLRVIEFQKGLKDKYAPSAASGEFENSAQSIIDKVRNGILNQATLNARWIKSGDVIAGTTDITDPKYSGDPRVASSQSKPQEQKKKSTYELADFLVKKYQPRK